MAKVKLHLPSDVLILHLEDMQNIHDQMVQDLRSIKIENKIIHALNVKAAIELCKTEPIGFIISDWNLPDGTGFEFLKKVRGTAKFKSTPFLMCTTMDEVEDMINAINEGANEYLVKPWKRSELFEKMNSCWLTAQK